MPVPISDRARPGPAAAAGWQLGRLARRAAPQVVHAHGVRAGALAVIAVRAAFAGRRARQPAVAVTVHNAPPAGRAAGLGYRLLERACARRADAVLCVSPGLAARMRRLGARRVSVAVVPAPPREPPGPAEVAQAAADIGAAGLPVVLAVGRLAEQKDYPVLLDAAARWQQDASRPVLAIAGSGPLRAALAAQASRRGLAVRFLGERADVPALLAAAGVFVSASSWEGQPLAVQEALQAGVPVVACRAAGVAALTGDEGALLVPPGDPAALAAAVSSVLADPALAARLAAGAKAAAARLPSQAAALTAVTTLYTELMAVRTAHTGG